jgi:hypothetical protein
MSRCRWYGGHFFIKTINIATFALEMEAIYSIQCHIPEGHSMEHRSRKTLKFYKRDDLSLFVAGPFSIVFVSKSS